MRSEHVQQVVHGGPPVDPRLVVGEQHDHRLLGVVLVLDLADDLLEQVLDRHQAGRAAVLVEHDRDVDLAPLELVEQVVDRSSTRARTPGVRSSARRFGHSPAARLEERQQVLRVEDAHDLVHRVS